MTTSFPTDKTQPFVAENGVTYYWDSDRWRVKQYKLDAEGYATEDWTEQKIAEAMIEGEVDLTSYATIKYSDTEDESLQNQIDELGVTKGKVARYTCSSITGGFASRPGQLAFNSGDPTAVNQISFGTEDSDNVLTKPMADGDIIEFVDAVSNTVSRFKITDASGAPTGVEVEYVSGNNDFNVGEEEQVYIYPQNEAGASKEYVDDQDALKLDLTGGTVTGHVTFESSIDSYQLSRFKDGIVVKAKNAEIGGDNSFAAYPDRTSYTGRQTNPTDIVNKEYVDSVAGGVPIGTVVMWFGETAPTGWLICDGSSFDINTYAALHAHLQTVRNYKTGITPNFQGLYPGGAGSGHDNGLTLGGESKTNVYHSQRTAAPFGGNPTSLAEIPDGTTRTFNGSGGTNAYSNGISRVNISEGWDNVTRPPTLSVHFIIKA